MSSLGILLLTYALTANLVWFWRLRGRLRERDRMPTLEVSGESLPGPPAEWPLVSVLVPVRNEERNIRRCLPSLLSQSYPCLEIIILNDHSTDGTLSIARAVAENDPRVVIADSSTLPPDWVGKNFALHQAAQLARGDWLLFTDADVVHSSEAVAAAIALVERNDLDLLSLSPLQECTGFWERIIQPRVFELLSTRFDLRAINDPATATAAANGQFILIRRRAYDVIGGHSAVRTKVLEDVEIARLTKAAGFRIYFATTRSLVKTRMYVGFSEIWAGWTKNLFQLLDSNGLEAARTILNLSLLSILPFLVAFSGPFLIAREGQYIVGAGVLMSGMLLLLIQIRLAAHEGQPRSLGLAYPLGVAMLVAMIFNSWYRNATGKGITWKGRAYGSRSFEAIRDREGR